MTMTDGERALLELMTGNKRYVAGKPVHPNQSFDRRQETVEGQNPFATILTCSDSRVPPDIIFDQGIGDLFVIRVAGNIAGNSVIASAEYAAEHLSVPLLMVLGHTRCGAVTATIQGGNAPGRIGWLCEAIQPAVERARRMPGELLGNAVVANVALTVERLSASVILGGLARENRLKIAGAIYNLNSGAVEVIGGSQDAAQQEDRDERM